MLFLFAVALQGITTEYYIKALGLKVAYISITQTDTQINIKARSLMSTSVFPSIDNLYVIDMDKQFRPNHYLRKIKQKNVQDVVTVDYNYNTNRANMVKESDNSNNSYNITTETRDVFSFISYLASGTPRQRKFNIDANGCLWQASVSEPKKETVKTKLGKLNTNRYEIRFVPLTNKETPYVDMVTHNFVNADSRLVLWVADNKVPVKAVITKKAISMSWELIGMKQ